MTDPNYPDQPRRDAEETMRQMLDTEHSRLFKWVNHEGRGFIRGVGSPGWTPPADEEEQP